MPLEHLIQAAFIVFAFWQFCRTFVRLRIAKRKIQFRFPKYFYSICFPRNAAATCTSFISVSLGKAFESSSIRAIAPETSPP